MGLNDLVDHFNKKFREDRNESEALVAVECLLDFLKLNSHETIQGVLNDLREGIQILSSMDGDFSLISVSSACELFIRHITLAPELLYRDPDLNKCLIKRGTEFLEKKRKARSIIVAISKPLAFEGNILVHSYSRVIFHLLCSFNPHIITVYVTESRPDFSGEFMHKKLLEEGINSILILDSAVGFLMEKINVVLLGAESVCQNGGVINKIGSYSIAMCAKSLHKTVYVAAESFKFSKEIPLNNKGMPKKYLHPMARRNALVDTTNEHPIVDHTPPRFIDYILSDVGILGPNAVCDVVLDLYI